MICSLEERVSKTVLFLGYVNGRETFQSMDKSKHINLVEPRSEYR